MKSKSKSEKHGKMKKKRSKRECSCVGKWVFVPHTRGKRNASRKSTTSTTKYSYVVRKIKGSIKRLKPETIEKAVEIALKESPKDIQTFKKDTRIISIPKSGNEMSSIVPLFTVLSVTGVLPDGIGGILEAVTTTTNARNQIAEGKTWENDISISEHLILKHHKGGLGLYTKP